MMERSKYLQKCKECAMIKERGYYGVLKAVPDDLRVVWNGAEYYPISYELGFGEDGTVRHIAVIHDLKVNSVCYVPLKDVR